MTDTFWATLFRDLPTVAAVLLVGFMFMRYLDRWIDKIASATQDAAQQRQQEIIVLLERTLAATQMVETKLAEVVERNTRMLDATTVALTRVGESLAALLQAQDDCGDRLEHVEDIMLRHEQNVAARPCQHVTAAKRRPP